MTLQKWYGALALVLAAGAWGSAYLQPEVKQQPQASDSASEWAEELSSDTPVTLTVWAPYAAFQQEIVQYKLLHPHVTVKVENLQSERQLSNKYMEGLAGDSPPDLMVFTSRMLGSFNSIDGLADLRGSGVPFDSYRTEYGDFLWSIHQSLEGNRVYAVPFEFHPLVLFYRKDLMEQAELPSEPRAFSNYLKEAGGWESATQKLLSQGVHFMEWKTDPVGALANGTYIFGRDLSFQRDSKAFEQALNASLHSDGPSAEASIWNGNGQELLRQGRLGAVILPDWGEGTLSSMLPDQAGLWRAAPLPFETGGLDLDTGRSVGIPLGSEHKAEAARFLKFLLNSSGSLNWFKAAGPSSFLGDQDSAELYMELVRSHPAHTVPTPLDEKAFTLWSNSMASSMALKTDAAKGVSDARSSVLEAVSVPQHQLQHYLGLNGTKRQQP